MILMQVPPANRLEGVRARTAAFWERGVSFVSSIVPQAGEAVSLILKRVSDGDTPAAEELLPLVYEELRRLASARMRHETVEHTLQPTALVHEAYLRLVGSPCEGWQSRGHFFAAAAEAMRRILIDHARERGRLKRGGDLASVPLADPLDSSGYDPDELLAIHDALTEFEQLMPRKAALVKLRYFAGLDESTAAEALGISRATASRWWVFSRAWLYDRLKSQ